MDLIQLKGVEILTCVAGMVLAFIIFKRVLFPQRLATADDGTGLVPKGSSGLPYIGEIIQFASSDPVAFCKPRIAKYGKVFKTNLLGTPTIMVTCPDFAKYVFTDRQHQFAYTYPLYMEQLLGDGGAFRFTPETGLLIRRTAQSFFSPELLRSKVAEIESMALETLLSWAAGEVVESVAKESIKFTFNVGIRLILGLESNHPLTLKLQDYYEIYTGGLRCLPIKLPGTAYSRALKTKQDIQDELKVFITRRASSRKAATQTDDVQRDFLDATLDLHDGDIGNNLDDLAKIILLFLFGAREPVGFTITWAMKLLKNSPEALEAVTKENDDARRRKGPGEQLTWTDYKEMKYTLRVIQESLRVSSIASGPTRRAVEDVQFGGLKIPQHWNVMVLLPTIHKNSEYFPDPMRFDPSRFESPPQPNTLLPFGSGGHGCVGADLAKLEIFVFLHLLTTQFSWELTGEDSGIINYPWPIPKNGVPIKIRSSLPRDGMDKTKPELHHRS